MKWRLILGLAAFLVALLVVLPARWFSGLLPPGASCSDWRGSIWRGNCTGLEITPPRGPPPVRIDTLQWRMHPASLLGMKVSADVSMRSALGDARGTIMAGRNGLVQLRDASAQVVLDRSLLGGLPAGWSGHLRLQDAGLRMQGNSILAMGGQMLVTDLQDGRGNKLGSYRLILEPRDAPPFTGQLTDEGGAFETSATITVNADRSWSLDGTVKPRASASPEYRQQLELLGAPDGAGRYPLSMSGSFN